MPKAHEEHIGHIGCHGPIEPGLETLMTNKVHHDAREDKVPQPLG